MSSQRRSLVCHIARQLAGAVNTQLNSIAGAQNERAGILESPGDVGDTEIRAQSKLRTRDPHINRNYHLMILAMKSERAGYLDLRIALHLDTPLDLMGSKSNLRVRLTLEYLSMHFCIAPAISAFTAGRVHQEQTRGFSS